LQPTNPPVNLGAAAAERPPDRLLGGRVIVGQPEDGYRVAIDAVLLAAAITAAPGERILDLGCGIGSAALCLAWRESAVQIVGLDREAAFLDFARSNAIANAMAERVNFETGDVLEPPATLGRFDQVMANPPYLKPGTATVSAHPLKAAATMEGKAGLADWIACAAALLRPGGALTVIHRADRLNDLLGALAPRFGGAAILPIHPKRDRPAKRVIARAVLDSGESPAMLPGFFLHETDGAFTEAAESILRHGAALPMRIPRSSDVT
jgi:tRNA1(Val) A37 N6-methylase TrmN6